LVPAAILAVYHYPDGESTLDLVLDAAHGRRLSVQDGTQVGAEVEVRYELDPSRVLEIHRLHGPRYESEWLVPELVAAARRWLGETPFEEVAGTNRVRLALALERALRETWEAEGIRMHELQVWRLAEGDLPPTVRREDLRADPDARALFIGLDSADWTLIDPLLQAGRLPNLERLVGEGVRARLRTISPVLSPVIWTTVATGKLPQKHGIVDFLAVDARTGGRVPVTSNLRKTKALWNIFSETGVDVGVVAWWATWPAEEVDGFLVSDRVAYQLFGMGERDGGGETGLVYPAGLLPTVEGSRVPPASISLADLSRFLDLPGRPEDLPPEDRERVEEFRKVLAGTRTYTAIAEDLFRSHPTRFRAVYFEGLDTTSHLFMQFRPPRLPIVRNEQVRWFGAAVDRFYEYQDELLGRLLEEFGGDGVDVIVASDHGFRSGTNRPLEDARIGQGKAAEWHRKFGVLILSGPAFRAGVEIPDASVADVAPTILAAFGLPRAEDMDGRVLDGAFQPGFLEARPAGSLRTYDDPDATPSTGAAPIPSETDEQIVEKLTALGYLSQAGSNSHNNRGVLLLNQGKPDAAIEEFRLALEEEPDFLVARINLGRAYMVMGNDDEALAIFETVLRRDPESQEVENYVGNILMDRGDLEGAERHLRRAVAIEESNADAHNSLGILHERMGDPEAAMAEYRRVIQVDPDYGEGYNNLANVLKSLGRGEEAEAMYLQAIEADPGFVGSFNNLALLYQERGDVDGAIRYYRMALERAPDHPQVRLNLGSLYYAQGELEEARAEFERAIELDPEFADAHNNLGVVLGQLGDPEGEQSELRRAVELRPEYADARHNLGLAYLRAGQEQRGIDQLRRAVELEPAYISALVNLGGALVRQGRQREGIPYLERALGLNPQMPAVHNALAGAYLALGERTKGIEHLRASLAIVPDQPQIQQKLAEVEGS
ncbi:MAG: tetratricopeptide repeat protein, partial [Acidobacteriota bacterium]